MRELQKGKRWGEYLWWILKGRSIVASTVVLILRLLRTSSLRFILLLSNFNFFLLIFSDHRLVQNLEIGIFSKHLLVYLYWQAIMLLIVEFGSFFLVRTMIAFVFFLIKYTILSCCLDLFMVGVVDFSWLGSQSNAGGVFLTLKVLM